MALDPKTYLRALLNNNNLPHLLIFAGSHKEIENEAETFAAEWLQHITQSPISRASQDCKRLAIEGKLGFHTIERVRELIDWAYLMPFQAKGKVAILEYADRLPIPCANALLKTIEEPPQATLFILLTESEEKLLPTIRSRAQLVRFRKAPLKLSGKWEKEVEAALKVANFKQIESLVATLTTYFDKRKAELQKAHDKLYKDSLKEMTATARERIENEGEGELSKQIEDEVDEFFVDLLLAVKRDRPQMMDRVYEALVEAKTRYSRSTPLRHVLEAFLLKCLALDSKI